MSAAPAARPRRGRSAALALALALALAVTAPPNAGAQGTSAPATLIADRVEIAPDGRLIASGNVEAFQEDRRITAASIAYDPDTESLDIVGPITITDASGGVVQAEAAALDTDLRNGLLRSARLVLDRELQLAAAEITRVDGRYTQLTKTVTSSCEVCAANPVPLWQIRAEKVIHDELERQLYFENARFEVFGIPVLWLPRFRLPDPTLERATGFLTPSIRSTDELGFGVKIPYFIKIGDSRDLTLTPYFATSFTQTMELRYRQALVNGDIEVNAAVTRDDIVKDSLRGYLFADGGFDLRRGYRLDFNIETTSDEAYLLDYDYSDADRLESSIKLSRTARDRFVGGELIAYRSLRSSEDNETQPFLVADGLWVRKFTPPRIGGTARVQLESHAHQRNSTEDIIGRDVGRLTALADWRRSWVGSAGLVLETRGQLRIDQTWVGDDSRYEEQITEVTPAALVQLRWPWVRSDPDGVRHIIEPAVQVAISPQKDTETPIDESTQLELDEGNLFALSRFPAGDVLERGLRGSVGLNYQLIDPGGVSVAATVGRIFRSDDFSQFEGYEILEGSESDWLAAVRVDLGPEVAVSSRALFDEEYDPTRNDLRFDWRNDMIGVAGTWSWLRANAVEMRPEDTNEWRLDGAWQIDDNWRAEADWRYDLQLDRSASARVGLQYRTECARFDLGVRRRFTSSEQLRPTTDVNFEVSLEGFGNRSAGSARVARSACRS